MMPEMPLAAAAEPQGYYTSVYSGEEIDAAIGALLSNVTIYSATSTYEQGAYVLYDGQLYTANQTISSPEPWNPAHWTKVNILDVLKNAATRAVPAAAGNLAALSATGDLQDSGKQVSDFSPAALQANITLYVNSATGNDTNNGTQSEPYLTLAAALGSLPKDLGGYTVTINVSGTFSEAFQFGGFHNGEIVITGTQQNPANFTNSGTVYLNDVFLTLQYITFSGSQSTHPLIVRDNGSVLIDTCTFDASAGGNGPLARRNKLVQLRNCTVNNASGTAFLAPSGLVTVQNLGGSNNGIAISVGDAFYNEIGSVIASGFNISATTQAAVYLNSLFYLNGAIYGGA